MNELLEFLVRHGWRPSICGGIMANGRSTTPAPWLLAARALPVRVNELLAS